MKLTDTSAFLLTFFPLFAQPTPTLLIPVIGTIESVSGNTVHVRTGAEPVAFHTDGRTEVWRGKKFPES